IDRSNGGIHAADDTGEIPVDLIQTDHWSAATPTWKASSNGAFCSLTSCSAIERGYSVAKTGELTPVAITAVTFPLLIDAAVNDNTILGSDETIKLDGNVTISV
ncbi:glutamate synthase operon protein GltF, partial [Escherichia coli]|nr:glutamate synthase operon protein GltF [Escherichia coli]